MAGKIIIRNDDVNSSTNNLITKNIYSVIKKSIPNVEIWSCITIFNQDNKVGSIYKEVPFKGKTLNWHYKNFDQVYNFKLNYADVDASHGLFHVDHSSLTYDAQEMSIVSSCRILKTNIFVPPFNRYNSLTEQVCKENGIQLIKPEGWFSLEYNDFNPKHKKWYFHSWRYGIEQLQEQLQLGIATITA